MLWLEELTAHPVGGNYRGGAARGAVELALAGHEPADAVGRDGREVNRPFAELLKEQTTNRA